MTMEFNSVGRADHHPVGHEGPSGIWDEVDTMRFLGTRMTDGCVRGEGRGQYDRSMMKAMRKQKT